MSLMGIIVKAEDFFFFFFFLKEASESLPALTASPHVKVHDKTASPISVGIVPVILNVSLIYIQYSKTVMVEFWKTIPPGVLSNELSREIGRRVSIGYLNSGNSGPRREEEATWAFKVLSLYQYEETWKYNEATGKDALGLYLHKSPMD